MTRLYLFAVRLKLSMTTNKPNYIVIVSSVSFPYGNASDNAIYTFMDGFNEHGCEGEVVCLYPNLPNEYDCPPQGDHLGVKYTFLHGKTHRSKNRIRNKIDISFLSYYLLKKYLKNKVRDYQITALFVTHVGDTYYKHTKLCHSLGIKTVLVSCEYPEYLIQSTPERIETFKKYSSYTDKYIFETKTLDDYTRNALGEDVDSIVVPATMPYEDILQCNRTEQKPYIAYCGSIHSEAKDGLKSIIRAFSVFHKHYPEIELKFIGRVSKLDYFSQLKELTSELGLSEYITFVGGVDRDDYVQYVTNSSLMIVAKPKDSYYGGGLSSKVIEYLFSGNPVLMTDSDDYTEYLTHGENVYFVSDNNPDTLSSGLIDMYTHPEMMKSIGVNGREYALNHFDYHKLTRRLLEFILG